MLLRMVSLHWLLLTTLFSLFVVPVQAKLPKAVLIDKHKIIVLNALKNQDCKKAIKHMDKLEQLTSDLPQSLIYFKGECYYKLGNYSNAMQLIETYLTKVGRDGKYYDKALNIYTKVEEYIESKKEEERRLFKKVNDLISARKYLKKYPSGIYVNEVKNRKYFLCTYLNVKKCNGDWSKYTFKYNSDGNLISRYIEEGDGSWYKDTYEYNSDGNLISRYDEESDGSWYKYTY